jgi:hypothetical protein
MRFVLKGDEDVVIAAMKPCRGGSGVFVMVMKGAQDGRGMFPVFEMDLSEQQARELVEVVRKRLPNSGDLRPVKPRMKP